VKDTNNETTTTTTTTTTPKGWIWNGVPKDASFAKEVDPELYAIITVSVDSDDLSVLLEIGRETPGLASHGPASNGSDYPSLEAAIQSAQRRGVHHSRIFGRGVIEYFMVQSEIRFHASRIHPDMDLDPTAF
jgi:hypothetical protein